jgi:hypothetical protein
MVKVPASPVVEVTICPVESSFNRTFPFGMSAPL